MAKTNYGFEKRQRELKKHKEQEEKRLKKLARKGSTDAPAGEHEAEATPAPEQEKSV